MSIPRKNPRQGKATRKSHHRTGARSRAGSRGKPKRGSNRITRAGKPSQPRVQKPEPSITPEVMFERIATGILVGLRKEFPHELKPEALSKRILSYLDLGGKVFSVPYRGKILRLNAEFIAKKFYPPYTGENLEVTDQPGFKECVEPLMYEPLYRLLHDPIDLLRKRAEQVNLKWSLAEQIIRKLVEYLGQNNWKPSLQGEAVDDAFRNRIRGPRNKDVAIRRTTISNLLRSDPQVSHKKICGALDEENVNVPGNWRKEGFEKWLVALHMRPNNVHKLISKETKIIRGS